MWVTVSCTVLNTDALYLTFSVAREFVYSLVAIAEGLAFIPSIVALTDFLVLVSRQIYGKQLHTVAT